MERPTQMIIESIFELGKQAFTNTQVFQQNEKQKKSYSYNNTNTFFDALLDQINALEKFQDHDMDKKEIEAILKKTIEPMLFDWIKEHMPRIAKEVLVEVAKKNKMGQGKS